MPNENKPLYVHLATLLRDKIENQTYKPNSQIPTELDLSEEYNVSRITIRKAIESLVDEGLLVRRQGKGTFVTDGMTVRTAFPFTFFNEACKNSGKEPKTVLLKYSIEEATRKQANFFGIKEGDQVIEIIRLRYANNVPVILETCIFPMNLSFLANEPMEESLESSLSKHGIHSNSGKTTTSIVYASEDESYYLNVEIDHPLMMVYSEIYDQNKSPIQISKQIINTELYILEFNF